MLPLRSSAFSPIPSKLLPVYGGRVYGRSAKERRTGRAALHSAVFFLDASSRLYNRVCPSAGPSVRPSVQIFFVVVKRLY